MDNDENGEHHSVPEPQKKVPDNSSPSRTRKQRLPATIEISPRKQSRIFKIIVIGDSSIGKTCLTFRFCEGNFPGKIEATIGVDFREKMVQIGDECVKLQLWDTAGQERFRKSMVPHYYRNVHAVVFAYDMTNRKSFESMPAWIQECDKHNLGGSIPKILVGNKCDLHDSIEVSTNEAQQFADLHNMPLFETSAKDDSEVSLGYEIEFDDM